MINDFVNDIASQMSIKLSKVSVIDGQTLGCLDSCLIDMTSKGKTVGALISKGDIECLDHGTECPRMEVKIRASLSRLQTMCQPF
ncbi:MAG TPA: hypothetical protein VN642_16515 [Dongiaceae bacterium]|nr:hypothetical protein [Dongiaceae bacterium]